MERNEINERPYYSLEEILLSWQFLKAIEDKIKKVRTQRRIPPATLGARLKRISFDELYDVGLMKPLSLSREYMKISESTSKLSSQQRKYINDFCFPIHCETVKILNRNSSEEQNISLSKKLLNWLKKSIILIKKLIF